MPRNGDFGRNPHLVAKPLGRLLSAGPRELFPLLFFLSAGRRWLFPLMISPNRRRPRRFLGRSNRGTPTPRPQIRRSRRRIRHGNVPEASLPTRVWQCFPMSSEVFRNFTSCAPKISVNRQQYREPPRRRLSLFAKDCYLCARFVGGRAGNYSRLGSVAQLDRATAF